MDVSDEDLTKILLQANGNVVMMVQEQREHQMMGKRQKRLRP